MAREDTVRRLELSATLHAEIALQQIQAVCQDMATLLVDEQQSIKPRYARADRIRGLLEQLVLEMR